MTKQKRQIGQENILLHNYWNQTTFVQTVSYSQFTFSFVAIRQIFIKIYSLLKCTKWGKANRCVIFNSTTVDFQFWHNILHKRNIFSCPERLKPQEVAVHFPRQCLYAELPHSVGNSVFWQGCLGNSTNWLKSMSFSFNLFFTFFSVSSLGRVLRNNI